MLFSLTLMAISLSGNSFGYISEEIWTFFFTNYGGGPAVRVQEIQIQT